jgi:hypothetical protein
MRTKIGLAVTLFALSAAPAVACPGSGGGMQAIAPDRDVAMGDEFYADAARQYSVLANEDFDVSGCGGDLAQIIGYFTTQPSLDFELSYLGGYTLNFFLKAECAAALLVYSHADGYWEYSTSAYSDPNARAELAIMNPTDGIYSVWVGTTDGKTCDAAVTLSTS